jgi:AbrB family looped-hinge helix DNA binding protein
MEVRMNTTVSEKGQIAIPKPLRKRLGTVTGTKLTVEETQGTLVLRRVIEVDPVSRAWGILADDGDPCQPSNDVR